MAGWLKKKRMGGKVSSIWEDKEAYGKGMHDKLFNEGVEEKEDELEECGEGEEEDIEKLELWGKKIKESSLCGLGQTAPNPVLTTIRYYRDEYQAHINEKRCPAGSCNPLVDFHVDSEKCTGCTLCAKNCPVDAISGNPKEKHVIDNSICVKCGKCITSCQFGAIYKS